DCGRVVCWKNDLVEEEMIADKDCRLHRLGRDLRRLRNVIGKDQDKDDGEDEAFGPFANDAFAAWTGRVEMLELFEKNIRFFEFDEVGQPYIGYDIRSVNRRFFHVTFRPIAP